MTWIDFINDIDKPLESRTICRDKINGFIVSTVHTSDEGPETAIIDKNDAHPVERYPDEKEAIEGHKKWLKIMQNPPKKIKSIGWSEFREFLDREVTLEPMEVK